MNLHSNFSSGGSKFVEILIFSISFLSGISLWFPFGLSLIPMGFIFSFTLGWFSVCSNFSEFSEFSFSFFWLTLFEIPVMDWTYDYPLIWLVELKICFSIIWVALFLILSRILIVYYSNLRYVNCKLWLIWVFNFIFLVLWHFCVIFSVFWFGKLVC